MAEDRKRAAKSETLTIRLNPRTRFVLEFVARMRGQTITTVVERALEAAGEQAKISDFDKDKTWRDFWDVNDGVRAINMAREPELFPTYEEEKRLKFVEQFREYFYRDDYFREPIKPYIDVLWPRIDEFIEHFEKTKASKYYSVEEEMRKTLRDANLTRPKSRHNVTDPPRAGGGKPNYDLDDDIPT